MPTSPSRLNSIFISFSVGWNLRVMVFFSRSVSQIYEIVFGCFFYLLDFTNSFPISIGFCSNVFGNNLRPLIAVLLSLQQTFGFSCNGCYNNFSQVCCSSIRKLSRPGSINFIILPYSFRRCS